VLPEPYEAPTGAPDVPSDLASIAVSNSRIDASWNNTGETPTDIYFEYRTTGDWVVVPLGNVENHSLTELTKGAYQIRVRAENMSGSSGYSGTLTVVLNEIYHYGERG
jgi:hypothetical protein